jgi:soluble lytic murein transglycosylase-like protein
MQNNRPNRNGLSAALTAAAAILVFAAAPALAQTTSSSSSSSSSSTETTTSTESTTTTSTTTTTTTTVPTTTTQPQTQPHKTPKAKKKAKKKKKKAKRKPAILGIPGLTPLGTPGELIAQFNIPPFLLPIYQAAGIEYGIPWQLLAAINSIETDYGRNLSVSSAGALGWMQFMPGTWDTYGVDASGDGKADPYNPADAIFAAAKYLKASGGASDLRKAVFSYNHADWYVNDVIKRARLLAGLPNDIVGSLTGLAEAMYPVTGKVAATPNNAKDGSATSVTLTTKPGAKVTAVADGTVIKLGQSKQLGRYIVLRDAFGNTYTYSGLGTVARRFVSRKEIKVTAKELSKELRLSLHGEITNSKAATTDGSFLGDSGERRRLFANPARPSAFKHGGEEQLSEAQGPSNLSDWFTVPVNIKRKDAVVKTLKVGSTVIGGTILGGVTAPVGADKGTIKFQIQPAGKNSPAIDPRPIMTGWTLLAKSTRRGAGLSLAAAGNAPTIGQVLLMGKNELGRRVLTDSRITIYDCGRADIEAGGIDRRVLASLIYLADNGMNPTVSSLHCGHSYLSKSGNVSEHSAGAAVDVAAINGTPILGNQGVGSITDKAVRLLLALQGAMKPHQIITLMTYPGTDNTLALADHDDHIHLGFHPDGSTQLLTNPGVEANAGQWSALVDRLLKNSNPKVAASASKYAKSGNSKD